jgi:tetratricopeptide (TPR) repeat protein
VIPSEILDVYKKVTRPDKYERPDFLSEWLKAQLDKNEKAIFLLKMERDTGKTSFSKALDGLKPIEKSFTKEEFLEDFRCRTYNIESSIFFEEKHFLSGLYNVLTSNNDNTHIQNGIVGLNPFENKKSEMIRLLDEVRDAAELNYSEEKLLLVIDGLDEVPSDTLDSNFRNIFSYIPKSEDLPEGVFILLTSRRYIEIENGNLKTSIKNIERNADSVLEIDRKNNLYKKLLLSYVSKVTKRLNIKTKENILKYGEYRFGFIKLFTTLVKGNRQFDFKNINENIIVFLLNKLKNTAGNKYVNRAKNMMIVLGYFKIALSAEELAELQNETLSLNFLALIHDLDGILKKIRTGIGTLYALSHEDMRNLIQDIYFENNNFLISNWTNELIQLKKNIDGKTDITRLILLSRCFDILNYKNKNILNREVTKNIFNILISEYNEDRIFEMRSLKLILSAHYQLLKMKDYLTEDEIQDTYLSISKIYLKIGFYEKSESVINRACNMLLTQGKKYSKKHLMMLDLLARIYYKRSYYEQSKTMYEEIIKNKIKIYGKDDIETVRSKFKYAVLGQDFLLDDGLDKSKKLYKEVLTIQKEKLGIKNSETSWTMNNLADIYWKQGKVDKAQELFIEALENRKEMLGDNHPDVAWIMNFVAGTYYDKAMIVEAKEYYKNTLNIRKSNLGSNHPDYAWTLNDYGKILIANKKLDTAKSVYINSNKIFSTRIGKLHPYTATVLNNLGHLYFEMSEFDLADKYFKDAITAKETQLTYTNPFLANTYNNYACFLIYKKEFEKAYDYLIKSINIYNKALGKFSLDKAVALTNLAVMYLIKDDKIKVKEIISSIDEILNAYEYNVLEYIKLSDVYNKIISFINMSSIKIELNLNINGNVDLKMIPVTSFNNSSEIIHILDLDILKNK